MLSERQALMVAGGAASWPALHRLARARSVCLQPRGSGRARDWGGTTLVLALLHSVTQLPRKCGTLACVARVEMPTGSFCFTSRGKGGSQEAIPKVFFSAQKGDRKLRFSCHFFLQWAEAHEKFVLVWLLFSHQPLSLHPEALKKSKSDGFLGMLICWHKEMCWGNSLPALLLFETSTEHLSTSHLLKQNHKLHQGEVSCTVPVENRGPGCSTKRTDFFFLVDKFARAVRFFFLCIFQFHAGQHLEAPLIPVWGRGLLPPLKVFLFSFIEEWASSCKPSYWFGRSLLRRRNHSLCFTTIKIPLTVKRWHETALWGGEEPVNSKEQPRNVSESFQEHQSGSPRVSTGTVP